MRDKKCHDEQEEEVYRMQRGGEWKYKRKGEKMIHTYFSEDFRSLEGKKEGRYDSFNCKEELLLRDRKERKKGRVREERKRG